MSDRSLEHTIKSHEFSLVAAMEHIESHDLAFFALDMHDGEPLEKYCRDGVTPEQVMRNLAYGTILRELLRRDEV